MVPKHWRQQKKSDNEVLKHENMKEMKEKQHKARIQNIKKKEINEESLVS